VFGYIEGWYNPHRRHSALDDQSLAILEQSEDAEKADEVGHPLGMVCSRQVDCGAASNVVRDQAVGICRGYGKLLRVSHRPLDRVSADAVSAHRSHRRYDYGSNSIQQTAHGNGVASP